MTFLKIGEDVMAQNSCYRINPAKIPQSKSEEEGIAERELFHSALVTLRECQFAASKQWSLPEPSLLLITGGRLELQDGKQLALGDIHWCNSVGETLTASHDGATVYLIEPREAVGLEMKSQTVVRLDTAWENFDDPAGRPTQPVQVLLDGSLSALRTRFEPSYIAGEHWHDFDTLYFITDGRMQFGDEGWFDQGEIRAVHGGHSYGPERPGVDGVEFVLVSLGGPVALHWSDLEPPP